MRARSSTVSPLAADKALYPWFVAHRRWLQRWRRYQDRQLRRRQDCRSCRSGRSATCSSSLRSWSYVSLREWENGFRDVVQGRLGYVDRKCLFWEPLFKLVRMFILMVSPDFEWIPRGPMQQFFESRVQLEFLDSSFTRPGEFRVFA